MFKYALLPTILSSFLVLLSSCGDDSAKNDTPFTLNFKAMAGDLELNCDDEFSNVGPNGAYSIGVGDLRFYVSNLKFYGPDDQEITATLDENNFQLNHPKGSVALIDFTSKDSGFCAKSQLGTPRTNTKITGMAADFAISGVSFDVGVPQAVMKAVIADSVTLTDAPSPLSEMTWSWASGYKHMDVSFALMGANNTLTNENSAFHIGSKDCGTAGKALSEKDSCGLQYTPKVRLYDFDPANNMVTIDLAALLANTKDTDFVTMVMADFGDDESVCINEMRMGGKCAIGTTFGTVCHSSKSEASCASIFPSLGLNLESGEADSATNTVFGAD